MCPPILGLVIGVIGSFAQYAMTSNMAKQQAIIEQRQLKTEIENERISAMQKTNDRLEELRKAEATNRAALSATGVSQNISYEEGISPYNKKVAYRDVERENFNSGQVIGRKKYEIAVAGWKAKATSRNALLTAGSEAIGAVGNYATRNS